MRLIKSNPNINFSEKQKFFISLSIFLCLASFILLITKGLNYGIDFSGGYSIIMEFKKDVQPEDIRKSLSDTGLTKTVVQAYDTEKESDRSHYLIRIEKEGALSNEKVHEIDNKFKTVFADSYVGNIQYDDLVGNKFEVEFSKTTTITLMKDTLSQMGFEVGNISQTGRGDKTNYTIILKGIGEKVEKMLQASVDPSATALQTEYVGPQVGKKLREDSFFAITWALAIILLYIAFRFDFYFSPGAVVALIHDVLITVGALILTNREVNITIIAALLTIVGYSLNDTIIIYDRIRENTRKAQADNLIPIVNKSLNETLSRTILTSATTLMTAIILFLLGGGAIEDFAFAMIVGVTVGTYSSIFIASPIYVYLRERFSHA